MEDDFRDAQGWSSEGHSLSVLPKLSENALPLPPNQRVEGWGAATAEAITSHSKGLYKGSGGVKTYLFKGQGNNISSFLF